MSAVSGPGNGDANTRAVVVDDSRFMRTLIRTLLEDGGIDVVAEAENGADAVDVVGDCEPDVVTMDIEMPEMNGLEAVETIMSECPTPVLMLSAHADDGAEVTFEALDKGAVDFVTKPGGEVTSSMPRVKRELVEKVRSAAAVDLSAARKTKRETPDGPEQTDDASEPTTSERTSSGGSSSSSRPTDESAYPDVSTLIVGASTGGPNVVERVLGDLPTEANLRILVVQHMPKGFTARFADRLNDRSEYDVREATDGEQIGVGEARIAPGGSHLLVTRDRGGRLTLELTDTQPVHGVKPAIDLTMASAVESVEGPLAGVLLTGMGRDGVDGMGRIHGAGGHTVAQDEETSAIFGMPKRAIETGCVDTIAPAEGVADGVLRGLQED
ncbi:chemotaxis-specific protein-glutamate methyltransferase CheB [Halopelagius longus]|uniref:Protein-glutamate methylesterase/protein-glutamine glutaminase n=1 Tax=Halopelagius longus TaxID=1236180 RepID=A0A1H1BF99_9EURY|nr:chemotaxis-specific protein-glutamate methyltransferase CheB [Halopelagius longus]RDI70749.1 chemotaxis-specific protein-glutamate methyltransferase CheB [Halopelagius longus]SDQ50066.1 two-component system, chemotaxis family, response regulator CheB [Halopelagius longus]